MKFHFQILLKSFLRKVDQDGMHPAVAISFILTVVMASILLVHKYAPHPAWILSGVAILATVSYKQTRNDQFMLATWRRVERFKLRMLEYSILVSPFVVYLLITISLPQLTSVVVVILSLAYLEVGKVNSRVIPSPFRSRPFEFGAGFRRTFLIYPAVIFLLMKGVEVDNFNLSLASIILLLALILLNYNRPEDGSFLETFSKNAPAILRHKLRDGIYNSLLLFVLPATWIAFSFPGEIIYLFIVMVFAFSYLILMIYAKYSAFPDNLSISQAVLLSFTIWFPPLVFVFIFIFRKKAIENLTAFSYD